MKRTTISLTIAYFKIVLGLLMIAAGIILGFYVGGWLLFIGGIIQFIQSVHPVIIASGIAWGIFKVLISGVVGVICGAFLVIPGAALTQ